MYDNAIFVKGKHADYMKRLASKFGGEVKCGMFQTNVDVYLTAAVVGITYNRKAVEEKGTESIEITRIHEQQISKNMADFTMNYQLLRLLEYKDMERDVRIEKVFLQEDDETCKEVEKRLHEYVLGGIEVLYEKLMKDARTTDDYVRNLFAFVTEFQERYQSKLNMEEIQQLCRELTP